MNKLVFIIAKENCVHNTVKVSFDEPTYEDH